MREFIASSKSKVITYHIANCKVTDLLNNFHQNMRTKIILTTLLFRENDIHRNISITISSELGIESNIRYSKKYSNSTVNLSSNFNIRRDRAREFHVSICRCHRYEYDRNETAAGNVHRRTN